MARYINAYLTKCLIAFLLGLTVSILAKYVLKIDAVFAYLSLSGATLVLAALWAELLDMAPQTSPLRARQKFAGKALILREQSVPAAKIISIYGAILLYVGAVVFFAETSASRSFSHAAALLPLRHTSNLNLYLRTAPAWLAAIGTVSAVIVALWQILAQRRENASQLYFEKAETALRTVVEDFLGKTTPEGRPLNHRRHWLNFARGIGTAQELANKIKSRDLKDIWKRTEHYWRERTYDALSPQWGSFPVDYYGYSAPEEQYKNFAQLPQERAPLSEPSLVSVYGWAQWPKEYPDPLDREMQFTDEQIDKMEIFGPRGLAEYIKILRNPVKPRQRSGTTDHDT